MKPKSNYTRVMAGFYIFLCLIASMIVGELIYFDVMMAKRKISLGELAERIDLTPANLSILKTGKAKAVRFSTLEAICKELNCQPGDILEYQAEE